MAAARDKNATLVGFFLFLGMLILGVMIAQFSNIRGKFDGDYKIEVIFSDASGLVKDSDVTRGGAKIGRVLGSPEIGDDGQIRVVLSVKGNIKIQDGASFSIYSVSLLGDKAVAVKEPEVPTGVYLQDGATVIGEGGGGIDEITSEAQNVAKNLNEAILEFKSMVASLKGKMGKVDATVEEFDKMIAELTVALKTVNTDVLTKENAAAVKNMIANIEASSASLRESSVRIKPLVDKVEPLFAEARETMAGVKQATNTAELAFAKAGDQIDALGPAVREFPETLKNLQQASVKARVMMEKFSKVAEGAETAVAQVNHGDGLLRTLAQDSELKSDAKDFVKNLKQYGVLRYRNDPSEEKKDPKSTRFRGGRR